MPHSEPNALNGSSRAANLRVISVALAVADEKLKERVLAGLEGEKFLVTQANLSADGPADVLITDQSLACAELAGFHDRLIAGEVGVLLLGRNLTADVLLPHDFTRRELRLATRMLAQVVALRRQNRRLQKLAATDALTQLPNRRSIEEHFAQLVSGDAPIALALIDLDQFKVVNSKLGYLQGDDVLRSVGKVLATRGAPHFVGRLGGDEFVAIVPTADEQTAFDSIEALRHAVALAASMKAGRPVCASAGIAIVSGSVSFTQALSTADAALRRAKEAGGKRTERAEAGLV